MWRPGRACKTVSVKAAALFAPFGAICVAQKQRHENLRPPARGGLNCDKPL